MPKPDTIIIEGRAHSWRSLLEIRRQQLAEWRKAQGDQPALFALRDDCRPEPERTAAGRFREPSLFARPHFQQQNQGERP
jgi:hypothetical protein